MYRRIFLLIITVIFCTQHLSAQQNFPADTIAMNISQAEKLFLAGNFQLLVAKYEISASDAAILQSRLYPNPNLSVDQGAYNPMNKKWFDTSPNGETSASLQQVIILAGKRNKQINIAKINSQISSYQFYDLVRTLRYEMRISFYGLYFLRESISVYDREIESLKSLIDVYTDQYKKGNVAFKELARLQSLQFTLENERSELMKDASEKQANLSLLTGDTLSKTIKPVLDRGDIINTDLSQINYAQLIDSALVNRPDLLIAKSQVDLSQSNLALQKSLRIPDVTLGANWDRQGSYIYNYNSLSLAIDLPFWNRNQGNVKMAGYRVEESKLSQSLSEQQVKNDIKKAYVELSETDRLYKSASSQFNSDYEKLLDGIVRGYQNHTISLLEFIDYYETYKTSKIEFNRLQNNRMNAVEEINLAVGSTVLK